MSSVVVPKHLIQTMYQLLVKRKRDASSDYSFFSSERFASTTGDETRDNYLRDNHLTVRQNYSMENFCCPYKKSSPFEMNGPIVGGRALILSEDNVSRLALFTLSLPSLHYHNHKCCQRKGKAPPKLFASEGGSFLRVPLFGPHCFLVFHDFFYRGIFANIIHSHLLFLISNITKTTLAWLVWFLFH